MGVSTHQKPTRTRTKEEESLRNLLLLSVAYSACIGGTGVITGNPSNLVILEVQYSSINCISQTVWKIHSILLILVFC